MAAWSRQSLPLFAINDSATMGMCDATTANETPIWRYVKHEVNTLAWASLIVVTFLLLRRLCAVLRLLFMGYRLPGPPARALNGRSKCLPTRPQMLQDLLGRLHQEYGPVVKIWTGPAQLLVSIKDTKLLQHMLEHAKDRVPSPRVALQLVYGHRSLFFSNHSKASQSRLRLEKEINGKFLGEAHNTAVKVAEKAITQLAELGKNNGSWEVDCMTFSRLMAFAALGTSLYGDGYMTWPVAREFENVMMEVIQELPTWMPYSVPPLWNTKFNQFRKRCQRFRVLARQLVANGEQTRFQESEDIRVRDENVLAEMAEGFVGSLFSSMGMELGYSVAEPRASGIMSHGSLNISGVLCSLLAQLALHPHIQTKVHDEILTVCGSEKPPTEADMKKMTVLTAIVHEAARLLPCAPFLQRCSVDHDIEVQPGVIIPAGAILTAPVQLIQEDKSFWGEDANIFNPDRFVKASNMTSEALASENFNKSNHDSEKCAEGQQSNPAFLVFGAGSRSCIGSNFVLKQISTLVAVILQQFELKEISDTSCAETKGQLRRLTLSPR